MYFSDQIEEQQYTEFVEKFENCTVTQTYRWGNIKNNWQTRHVAVYDNDNHLLLAASILINKGLWYLPRGPIMEFENENVFRFFLQQLKQYAKKNKAKMLKLDIPYPLQVGDLEVISNASMMKKIPITQILFDEKFKHLGLSKEMKDTIQPRFETVSPLPDNFPDNLSKDTRKQLRRAEELNIQLKPVTLENLDEFLEVIQYTENRKGISLRSKEYYVKLLKEYKENIVAYISYIDLPATKKQLNNQIQQLKDELLKNPENAVKKKVALEDILKRQISLLEMVENVNEEKDIVNLTCCLSVCCGKRLEMMYAAMNEKYYKFPAQILMYVHSMLAAKQKGATVASMGGIECNLEDGLLKFKMKFKPKIIEYYGEFDYIYSHIYAFMYKYGVPVLKKFYKLKSKLLKK